MASTTSVVRPARPTYGRPPVYSIADRSVAVEADALGAAPTLSGAAVAAMTDPDGITALLECALEVESNRLQRPTTVVLRDRNLASVPVLDPGMSLATLTTGRRNPTARYAVADVSIADDGPAYDGDPTLGDEVAVGFGDPMVVASPAGNPVGAAGSTLTGWQYLTAALGSPVAMTPTADTVAPVPSLTAWGITGAPVVGKIFAPASAGLTYYRIPAGTSRTFTVIAYGRGLPSVSTADVSVAGHLRVDYTTSTVGGAPGAPVTVQAAANSMIFNTSWLGGYGGASYSWTVTAGASDLVVRSIRPMVVVDTASALGGTITGARVTGVQVYAGTGNPGGAAAGLTYGVPQNGTIAGAVVELTWADLRTVNRIEATGERRTSRITSAHVEITLDGSTWIYAGRYEGSQRPAILLDADYLARGVRFTIEETTGADPFGLAAGRVFVTEVDPMYVRDVTDEVASAELTWQREANPGDGTIPVGNYQASTIDLELDNRGNRYTPSANAAIDTGHRIECALGVRYSNVLSNPRADVSATGWVGPTRTTTVADGWPYATAFALPVTAPGALTTATAYGPSVPTVDGRRYRVTAWVDLASNGATGVDLGVTLRGRTVSGTIVGSATVYPTSSTLVDRGMTRLVGEVTLAIGATSASIEPVFTLRATNGSPLLRFTAKLEELDVGTNALVQYDELVSGGVFYSDAPDAPSDSPTVTFTGADRLGRFSDAALSEAVRVGSDVASIVRDLALAYLDLDEDQVIIASSSGSYVIPYAYPSGNVGGYLAELAKATIATLYVDALDRLVLTPRGAIASTSVAELRADNALIRYSKPTAADLTASSVKVTASPLTPGTPGDLWTLPTGGITIAAGASVELVADYSSSPAIGLALTGVTVSGGTVITDRAAFYSDAAFLTFRNPGGTPVTLTAAKVTGTPLVEQPLSVRRVDVLSRQRYGPREIAVDAPLVQTLAQVSTIADVLIDAFRGVDSYGVRRLPDVEIDALGLVHLTVDDRITITDPATGLGADYQLKSRTVSFADGALLLLKATGREAPSAPFALADSSIADDVFVAGY